ncbi:translocon-associated protein subunit beta [Phalaenopsis equestris]|uniref:translocon-associated protein subunit beta n=1 Tax=Phalaenopsis equestris TaxID=78828 RepID=UPI0009E25E84|nr:translocon-associated protein subunit beta [Phalaenopsis equestris]
MARPKLVFLFPLVVATLFVSSVLTSSDVPFMVANKKVSQSRLKSGAEQLVVSIDIFNEGSVTAYDVSLVDDSWPEDKFEVVSGSTSKNWERLDAGATASHSFVLESKVKGAFQGSPAVIKFRVPTKAALQEAFSTPIQPLDILADKPQEKKFEWSKRLLTKYGSQVAVLLFVGLFVFVLVSPSKSSAAKGGKKKR